ncbi:MAG: DUF1343 domain-containing protein [Kiritimatiellia bacterium]
MKSRFFPGIDVLLAQGALAGRRAGLVSHIAALAANGASCAEALQASKVQLAALFAPEHGYFGAAGAGDPVHSRPHPVWRIPVHSLYGRRLAPTPAQLRGLDVLIIDLQDLGARCYTYVSTLRHALEAAASAKLPAVVLDRPVPLPVTPDGPVLQPGFESFVGCVRTPLAHAMTPGEAARWIRNERGLDLDLTVIPMAGYRRDARRGTDWPPWVPPSPGIRSWESAACYLATVFTEGVPAVSCGRTTTLPFQIFGAPWLKAEALREMLDAAALPGVTFHPHPFIPPSAPYAGRLIPGLRMVVTDPLRFRPARVSVAILAGLQTLHGRRRLWSSPGTRPEFFDKLYGTDAVRLALQDGETAAAIANSWSSGLAAFQQSRKRALLYPDP